MTLSDVHRPNKPNIPSIKQIHEEWEKDSVINDLNLEETEKKIPILHAKYHQWWTTAQRHLIELHAYAKTIERCLLDYYQRKITNEEDLQLLEKDEPWQQKNNWNECRALVSIDPLMVKVNRNVDLEDLRVKTLENILSRINNRSFHIKNIIELRKIDRGYL